RTNITESSTEKLSLRFSNSRRTLSANQRRAKRSIRPVRRYWADFHCMSSCRWRGSRLSASKRRAPCSPASLRSYTLLLLILPLDFFLPTQCPQPLARSTTGDALGDYS